MTVHKLTTHGSRRTVCGLKVPDVIEVKPTQTSWDDGDEPGSGLCIDGCHQTRERLMSNKNAPAQELMEQMLISRQAPDWLLRMRADYQRTGGYRPQDLQRLLGDPRAGVSQGEPPELKNDDRR